MSYYLFIWFLILFFLNIILKKWEANVIIRIILNIIFLLLGCGNFSDDKKIRKINKKEQKIEQVSTNSTKNNIERLMNSQIGFYNAGGSCYMASIIQVLVHSKIFLEQFFSKEYKDKKTLASKFNDLLELIRDSKDNIRIEHFANELNNINSKFNGYQGNNTLNFYTEFIKELSKENNEVFEIFKGRKCIKFDGMSELNYEDDFLFLMITLDKNNNNINKALFAKREFEDDGTLKLSEELIIKPKILLINISHEDIDYKFEEKIKFDDTEYQLIAINRYSIYHSTV